VAIYDDAKKYHQANLWLYSRSGDGRSDTDDVWRRPAQRNKRARVLAADCGGLRYRCPSGARTHRVGTDIWNIGTLWRLHRSDAAFLGSLADLYDGLGCGDMDDRNSVHGAIAGHSRLEATPDEFGRHVQKMPSFGDRNDAN
jgi:hypothetical protein